MKYPLVGLAGRNRADVEMVAEYLKNKGYMRYGLSYPVKRGIAAMLNIGVTQIDESERNYKLPGIDVSPSVIIRDVGDFVRAHYGDDVLLQLATPVINGARLINKAVVITDVLTEEDAVFVRSNGGVILHLVRTDILPEGRACSGSEVSALNGDITIFNNSALFELYRDVAWALRLPKKTSRKAA
jgi:hypothetical protein